MVAAQPTRAVVKMLRNAGWRPDRTVGSHTVWKSEDGTHQVTVPDGHRTISPGVYRTILRALDKEDPS